MRALAILVAAALNYASPAQAQEAAADEATVLAAQRDRYERMTIPVTISGKGPFQFLVDTGAQATVVTTRVTGTLGIAASGKAVLVAMASRSSVDTVALDGLEFAGRRFGNLTAPLLDYKDVGADGIVGLDALQALRVVIDFRAYTLALTDSPLARNEGYEIIVRARRRLGQMIITDALVDRVRTAVIIDTGSWNSVANSALEKRLGRMGLAKTSSTDVTGSVFHATSGMLGKLQIGKLGLADLPVAFADSPAFEALGLAKKPALILGIANLRPFDRVAIDFATGKILFDVPEGAAQGL